MLDHGLVEQPLVSLLQRRELHVSIASQLPCSPGCRATPNMAQPYQNAGATDAGETVSYPVATSGGARMPDHWLCRSARPVSRQTRAAESEGSERVRPWRRRRAIDRTFCAFVGLAALLTASPGLRREDRRGGAQERRPHHGRGRAGRAWALASVDGRRRNHRVRMGQGGERLRRGSFRRGRSGRSPLPRLPGAGPRRGPAADRLEGGDRDRGPREHRPHATPGRQLLEAARRVLGRGGELHQRERALRARRRGQGRGRTARVRGQRGRERHGQLADRGGRHPAQPRVLELRSPLRESVGRPGQGPGRAEPRARLRPARLGAGGRRALPGA